VIPPSAKVSALLEDAQKSLCVLAGTHLMHWILLQLIFLGNINLQYMSSLIETFVQG